MWELLITAATAEACFGMGYATYTSNHFAQAANACTRAANNGDTNAMHNLGILLTQENDTERFPTCRWARAVGVTTWRSPW
ncbi:hypothetical protein ACFZAM_36500 [Streptomyces sp. NPDC008079]|uniref:hypothetical protein n=1 Tax=Streptomyces sp. NPDC008079 TaxID=3364806 RepID=UPI0036EA5524